MERSGQALAMEALVVSHDKGMVDQLQGLLEHQHACSVRWAPTYESAESMLPLPPAGLPRPVFVDLRPNGHQESPAGLLSRLASLRATGMPVFSIDAGSYRRDWAGLADAAVHAHLRWPIEDAQLRELMAGKLSSPTSPLMPRVVKTATCKYTTHTPALAQMLDNLLLMAAHDVTLLLVGETGTGKTTLARVIHELSPRAHEKLLTVACGALPPDLIESELFGHVKGAFTGAERTKIGKFEAADQGTLLLDEIDVLGPGQQTKLLRVIETGEFEPVGSNETRRSQARLIVASNVDLRALMERNEFRADLYYRLNVLEFQIPALRNRPLDIVPLTLDFIEEFSEAHSIEIRYIHPDFLNCLKNYDWPGNIRELKNHIRRAVLFCRNGELTPADLAPTVLLGAQRPRETNGTSRPAVTLSQRVACTEQEILLQALRANEFKRAATARALGISRVGLYKKMKKYGLLDRTQAGVSRKASEPLPAASPEPAEAEDAALPAEVADHDVAAAGEIVRLPMREATPPSAEAV
jgi:DNA-binding NtrC family response regulator